VNRVDVLGMYVEQQTTFTASAVIAVSYIFNVFS
jgi:hypothetical protein